MAKYILISETHIGVISYPGKDKTESEILEMMQRDEPEHKWQSIKRQPRGTHLCKYCGVIVIGTCADLLCTDCRETFGHSLYSEL